VVVKVYFMIGRTKFEAMIIDRVEGFVKICKKKYQESYFVGRE